MSGTVENDTQLLAEAADGQVAGSYTLARLRNIIASETAHLSAYVAATPENTELYNWNPATQLINYRAARAQVRNGIAGARCPVLCIGDSKAAGVTTTTTSGYRSTVSWPSRLITRLQNYSLPVQGDSWFGNSADANSDSRLAIVGTAAAWSGTPTLAGPCFLIYGATSGINFTLPVAKIYDRVDISYVDISGGGMTVAVDGGATISTITPANTQTMLKQTVTLPNASHTVLNIRGNSTSNIYLQGCAFWNSTVPAIEVYNGGYGGAQSPDACSPLQYGQTSYGAGTGAVAVAPKLAIIDIGTNDMNVSSNSAAVITANIMYLVTALRAINCDVVAVVTAPFNSTGYGANLPPLRAALQVSAVANNYGLVDWSHRYGDSYTVANANGMMGSTLHPSASCYDDIGSRFAELLANA